MPRIYLISPDKHSYKANLHCHTTNSDGVFSPAEIKRLYMENGYSIVAFTDHWHYFDNSALSDSSFLALSGYELNYDLLEQKPGGSRLKKTCHLCAIALDPRNCTPIPGKGIYDINYINQCIAQLNANGFIVNLNHTAWSAMPLQDILSIEGIKGMEVYNSTCEYVFNTSGEANNYSLAIANGRRLLPIVTDDNHRGARTPSAPYATPDCCRAFVMLRADRLDTEDIINAYLAGDFYCSNGPLIYEAYIENDRLHIECSPVSRAYLKSEYITLLTPVIRQDDTLTSVDFDISMYRSDSSYISVQLVDSRGRFAMTVPYYFSKESYLQGRH